MRQKDSRRASFQRNRLIALCLFLFQSFYLSLFTIAWFKQTQRASCPLRATVCHLDAKQQQDNIVESTKYRSSREFVHSTADNRCYACNFLQISNGTPHTVGLLALDRVAPSSSFYFRAYCWIGGSHLEGKSWPARVLGETSRVEITAGNCCAFARRTRRKFTLGFQGSGSSGTREFPPNSSSSSRRAEALRKFCQDFGRISEIVEIP